MKKFGFGTAGVRKEPIEMRIIAGVVVVAVSLAIGTDLPAQADLPSSPVFGDQHRENFGASLIALGDVDGDLIPDLAVGSPFYSSNSLTSNGRVRILSGAAPHAVLATYDGAQDGSQAGTALVAIQDLDGDQVDDLVVGIPRFNGAGGSNQGQVVILSGVDLTEIVTFSEDEGGMRLGSSLDNLGDIDGDGLDDLITGAPRASALVTKGGAAFVLKVTAAAVCILHRIDGDVALERMGHAVVGIGDADLDTVPDFLVSSPDYTGALLAQGRVRCYSGDSNLGWPLLVTLEGTKALEQFGWAMAAVPDPDGSSQSHAVITSIGYGSPNGSFSGAAWLHTFPGGGLSRYVYGQNSFEFYGASVACIGDQDGDDLEDFVVGSAVSGAGGFEAGLLDVIASHGTGTYGEELTPLYRCTGNSGDRFGGQAAALGDLDGDGCLEYAVAATGYTDPVTFNEVGFVSLVHSRTPKLATDKDQYFDLDNITVRSVGHRNSPYVLMAGSALSGNPDYQISFGFPWILLFGLSTDANGIMSLTGSIPDFQGQQLTLYLQGFLENGQSSKSGNNLLFSELATIAIN